MEMTLLFYEIFFCSVLISAHFDSWDLGTLDNAAGVATVLQAAEAITSLALKPLRTIRFVAWMNEEEGGSGYLQYFHDHKSDLPNHVAEIEIDVGTCHPLGYSAYASDSSLDALKPLEQILVTQRATVVRKSDEMLDDINEYGIASFEPLVDSRRYYDYHHTAADTFDKADPKGLQENARTLGYTVEDQTPAGMAGSTTPRSLSSAIL